MSGSIPWKRVLAEFAAIFAGVTLGLLAESWWQDQGDRAAAKEILIEVQQDLRADSAELEWLATWARSWDQSATRLIRMWPDPDSDPDSMSSAVMQLSMYGDYRPVSAGYVALRDGGHLADIADPELRRALVEYHEQVQVSVTGLWEDVLEVRNDFARESRRHFATVLPDSATSMNEGAALTLSSSRAALAADADLRGLVELQGIHSAVLSRLILPNFMADNQRLRELMRQGG